MKKTDEYFFDQVKKLAQEKSTCLKIKTAVLIVKNGKIIGQGWNMCSPEGFHHGKKVKECPRMKLPSGTGYNLCKSLHAEEMAILNTGPKRCKGATMYLSGHFYACWHCESLAHLVGIKKVEVQDDKAAEFYKLAERRPAKS